MPKRQSRHSDSTVDSPPQHESVAPINESEAASMAPDVMPAEEADYVAASPPPVPKSPKPPPAADHEAEPPPVQVEAPPIQGRAKKPPRRKQPPPLPGKAANRSPANPSAADPSTANSSAANLPVSAPSSSPHRNPVPSKAKTRSSKDNPQKRQASRGAEAVATRANPSEVELQTQDDADSESRIVRGSDMAACIVSAILHALILVLLATLVIPIMSGHSAVTLLSTAFDDEGGELQILESLEESAPPEEAVQIETVDLATTEPVAPEIDFPIPETPIEEPVENVSEKPSSGSNSGPASEATSVESAVDGVTGAILGELEKGDLLVVWLLDASHSLVDDRQRVADRLTPFFQKIDASRSENPEGNELMNAVVSFGATTRERVPPTKFGPRIVSAVKKLPIDASGKENVFAAIAQCASTYRKKRKDKGLMLVVWTDETGDDAKRLEQTIAICKQHKVKVSVVGPSSVLGAETGLHSYRDEKTKRRFLLPVNRGPDSAEPERLEVGYWFNPQVPGFPGRRGASLPSWYGGDDMKGVASGFSPYALTRLAAQTNGAYTIFDRPEDRGPFRIETLREYAPSYDSPQAYEEMIRYHPLRKAVMDAVEVTRGKRLQAPETMLFVKRSRVDPDRFERPYMTPSQFASQLRSRKHAMKAVADRMSKTIDEALRKLSKGGDINAPLDELYAQEKSPRWKAWYDLTRGRLLAVSVRLEEYRLALDAFADGGFLREATNHLILKPQQGLRSSQEFQNRAREAESLLMRCLEQNADTPWAYLAQRELANGLGVGAQQATLKLIRTRGPAARPASPSLPKF